MHILNKFNLADFKTIVERYAKFQKVMLVYDDTVSQIDLQKLHECIKEICIFNKMFIQSLNDNEICNGYKLLIFVCSADSFLKINFSLEDYVNVFIPTSNEILPFFVNNEFECQFAKNLDELALDNNANLNNTNFIFVNAGIDENIFFSFYFNNFVHCLNSIFFNMKEIVVASTNKGKIKDIEFFSLQTELNFLIDDVEYLDIKILKHLNLEYKFLPYIDYYLLLAFSVLISAIKQKSLNLVDVYKGAKENYNLIDNFYAKLNDNSFFQLLNLNFFNLKQILTTSFQNLCKLSLNAISFKDVKLILNGLKDYCKFDNGIFVYLYLFNIINF